MALLVSITVYALAYEKHSPCPRPCPSVCRIFHHIVKTTLDTTVAFDTTVSFDTTVAFIAPFLALLTSLAAMRREERLWNFSEHQRVHISNLVQKLTQN